jgi:hypothetical protein
VGDGLTLGSIEAIQDAVTRHARTTITATPRRCAQSRAIG